MDRTIRRVIYVFLANTNHINGEAQQNNKLLATLPTDLACTSIPTIREVILRFGLKTGLKKANDFILIPLYYIVLTIPRNKKVDQASGPSASSTRQPVAPNAASRENL